MKNNTHKFTYNKENYQINPFDVGILQLDEDYDEDFPGTFFMILGYRMSQNITDLLDREDIYTNILISFKYDLENMPLDLFKKLTETLATDISAENKLFSRKIVNAANAYFDQNFPFDELDNIEGTTYYSDRGIDIKEAAHLLKNMSCVRNVYNLKDGTKIE